MKRRPTTWKRTTQPSEQVYRVGLRPSSQSTPSSSTQRRPTQVDRLVSWLPPVASRRPERHGSFDPGGDYPTGRSVVPGRRKRQRPFRLTLRTSAERSKPNDAFVADSAMQQGIPFMTADERLLRFLGHIGYPAEP